MKMDGEEVCKGDNVHDIVFGAGTVYEIREGEDKFFVNFGNRNGAYNSKGNGHFPLRTLYWQDPIHGYAPMKNSKRWNHFCELRNAILDKIIHSTDFKEN